MKRVCIYCQTWESGGIEAFIHNILCHMDLSELKVDLVTEAMRKSVFTEDLLARGITFRELSGSPRKLLRNWCLFARLMKQEKYDVIHLNIYQALPMAYLLSARRGKGIPCRIVHSHNTRLRKSRTKALKDATHRLAGILFSGYATAFWACSADAVRFMFPAALLEKKGFRFIPNGIDLHRFLPDAAERERVRRQLGFEGAFVVGNIGRLCEQKNQSFLLEVFGHLHSRDPSARLLLIGEGEDLVTLEEKTSRLSLSEAVLFYGITTQVERLLWAMDVFVFPSTFEGLGIAAIEAQAAGLPTLCSDRVPGEVLASGLAMQLPLSASAEQWAQGIMELRNRGRPEDVTDQLAAHGFDIIQVSRDIQKAYLYG